MTEYLWGAFVGCVIALLTFIVYFVVVKYLIDK